MSHKYAFRSLGMDAGGYIGILSLDASGQKLVGGGDIQGFFISEDQGDHWRVANRGLTADFWHRVAAVAWSTLEPNTIYGCSGNLGSGGGFLASADGGYSWEMRSQMPQFAGNHSAAPLPTGHPRSTGNLIAQGGGCLYVGSYDGGVYRSTDNGYTWTNIGFSGGTHYVRSLIIDPNDSNTLYAALYGERIWKTTNASGGSPSWTQLTNAPPNPEELKMVGAYVYAVCNTDGVYRSTDGGSTWDSLNGSFLDTATSAWMSIDGYVSGSNHVVVAGCADAVAAGSGYRSLVKLTITGGGAVTYTDLTADPSLVNLTIAPDNRQWWRDTVSTSYKDWPSGRFYNPGYILIAPDQITIWVAGSCGVFRSQDGGTNWQLATNGMPLTTNRRVAIDPNHPHKVLFGNTDWTALQITDGFGTDGNSSRGWSPSSAGTGYDIAIDPADSTVFLAVGDRDSNIEGAVFSQPYGGTNWTNEGLENTDQTTTVVTDTFTRSAASSWGSADSGQTWSIVTGSAANFNVNGTQGTMQLPASAATRVMFLQTTSLLNITGTFDVSWDRVATGAGHFAAFHVRTDGTTNSSYAFRLDESTSGTLNIRVHRIVSTATQIGSTVSVSGYTPTSIVHVRYRVSGTSPATLNMKAWVGSNEPATWMITVTDTEATLQDAGPIGLRAGSSTGYTAGAIAIFDNLQVDSVTPLAVTTENKRPVGLTVGRDASNNRVLLAAVQESGLWRKVSGTWTRVDATICANPQTTRAAWFVWDQGSSYVYVFDRASGVYRSSDYGVTWTLIWSITSDVNPTGYLAGNPTVSNELWLSTDTALYRIPGANSGTVGSGITPVGISGVDRPGSIVFHNGAIFCVNRPTTGIQPQLLRSTDSGATWQDISDTNFKALGNRIAQIAVSPLGRIYAASLTQGLLVGTTMGQSHTML